MHSGGLASRGGPTLVVKRFVIYLDTRYLTARVAGAGTRTAAALRCHFERRSDLPGVLILRHVNVRLTAASAGALNYTFDTNLFKVGLPIGQAAVIATTRC